MDDRNTLLAALKNPSAYPHPVDKLEIIETHISWVILTGPYAYKIKKPVNLGFLDFSTLERRHFYCAEELRLNRRLAPQLYLDVVPITGTLAAPQVGGLGSIVEYALKLVQFSQLLRADHLLETGRLSATHIDKLAAVIADFHHTTAKAPSDSTYGTPDVVTRPALDNFGYLLQQPLIGHLPLLDTLHAWTVRRCQELRQDFQQRKTQGYVRECHGDLHLANIVVLNDSLVPFDCMEFNEQLRWIDVISDVAFVCMDLDYRQRPDLSARLLNAYLEISGDYDSVRLMHFYQCYRAMVRAKVISIQRSQMPSSINVSEPQDPFTRYAELAQCYASTKPTFLIITHGLSGSGKTWLSQTLLEDYGAIRIRSDVERKRLFNVVASEKNDLAVGAEFYGSEASTRTYQQLAKLAFTILCAGYPAIVDAACLKQSQRDMFRDLAHRLGVPFLIIDIQSPKPLLQSRILQRRQTTNDASDADISVLEHQLTTQEMLTDAELTHTLSLLNDGDTVCKGLKKELDDRLKLY